MKTILTLLLIAFVSCNDPKPPPDDGFIEMVAARNDSLVKADSLNK